MGQRRWNPGIKREGLFETVFDLRRNEGNSGICRRDWGGKSRSDRRGLLGESSRYGKRIGISVFLKSKSLLIEGARSEARMDVSEEGEVNGMEQSSQKEEKIQEPAKPSQAFLAELMETQGDQSKVILERTEGDQGLVLEQMGLDLMEVNNLASDVGMGLEDQHIGNIGNGTREALENDLYVLGEEEIEDDDPMQEVVADDPEEKKKIEDVEVNDRVNGEVEKRQGTHRKALKPSLAAVASNKMKLAQLVAAKRTVAKAGIRHGDHSKQGEEKGPSAPKNDPAKYLKDP
ncbi:hypothetical protein HID58_055837 [Brassica napus]|uniref:Uncharacterized protein n=1 Tax=Brassica napus TaxID=3708 RepID=A0ABQ8AMH5_BRANA|nr:hypothetical protein HID58_055837 [Brassica napus]